MGKTGRAKLKVIREGFFRWTEKRISSEVTCTSTYIEDGGKKIIVDTPHAGEEKEFLAALEAHGVNPLEVDYVVCTHHHPDHVGCLHLFPNAEHIGAGVRWRGARHLYWHEEALPLTDDVYVLKTPGHTPDSCSVVANTDEGVIAAVGDMWWSLTDPKLLVVSNRDELDGSRTRIKKLADFIIPGHGPMATSDSAPL